MCAVCIPYAIHNSDISSKIKHNSVIDTLLYGVKLPLTIIVPQINPPKNRNDPNSSTLLTPQKILKILKK